jgi:hypothetical protein
MATTHSFNLTASAWTLISDALANVLVQPQVRAPVLVHVTDTVAPPSLGAPALVVSEERAVFAATLPPTARVFARATAGEVPIVVVRG